MIFKFYNLGAIKETVLDLRPLTVIIGPNNSNKTYLAYSLYGLLRELADSDISVFDLPHFQSQGSSLLIDVDAFTKIYNNKNLSVCDFFSTHDMEAYFQDTSKQLFKESKIRLMVSKYEIEKACMKIAKQENLNFPNITFRPSFHDSNFRLDVVGLTDDTAKALIDLQDIFIKSHILLLFDKVVLPTPFVLPAERNSFVITYKLLETRRYKFLMEEQRSLIKGITNNGKDKRRLELLREQGDTIYPRPVEDFLDFLTDVEFEGKKVIDSKQKNEFQSLASYIEQNIQSNHQTLWKKTQFGGHEIKVHIKQGLDIDLYNASSSIKQLAPLLLYLRYRAKENDLLIIDEPEMNLHPESQAKLLEALAILVNLGVKVLLTTHSPYFMAHLNNLVSGNTNNKSALKRQADALYLKDERAFLPMDKVSAYEMKAYKNEFKLHDLKDPDYGIRWDTLSDVSAEIQQKFFEIHEKEKAPSRVKQKKKTTGKKQKPKR